MIRILLALFLCLTLSSEGPNMAAPYKAPKNNSSYGKRITRSVNVGSFNKIEASTAISVNFTQGPATGKAVISALENVVDYIKVEVRGETLHVGLKKSVNINRNYQGPFIVTVQAPVLKAVSLSAASTFTMENTLNVKGNFTAEASGASNITIPVLKSTNLLLDPSGASSIKIRRVESSSVSVDCSGASNVRLDEVLSPQLDVDASGASNVNVDNFSGHILNIEASGTAHTKVYKTDAETLNLDASGLSNIEVGNINANVVNADASSQSVIYVNGTSRQWNRDVSSGGKIKTNVKNISSSSSSSSSSWSSSSSSSKKKRAKSEAKKKTKAATKKGSPTQAP